MKSESGGKQSRFNIRKFIQGEAVGGLLLLLSTILAMIWANSGYYELYEKLWHKTYLGFSIADYELKLSLHHWINDGLMAVFFYMIGLEIKREVVDGELSTPRKASLPIAAAIGGMLFPAVIYTIFNAGIPQNLSGWGIPMATDIAFAVGLMSLLGKKVNINVKIFLTALAVADDLGAILVIAFFYTDAINTGELLNAAIFLALLIGANRLGIRRTSFYALVGFAGVWLSFLNSGVHATIAGVLVALTIPVRTKIKGGILIDDMRKLSDDFKKAAPANKAFLTKHQAHIINKMQKLCGDAHTPLQRLEHSLHPIVTYFILPLFALANAGVRLQENILNILSNPIAIGIISGLFIGKVLGITILSRILVKLKLAVLPAGVNWRQITGAGLMAGIGFTMSIFIANLAFIDEHQIQVAKIGIFTASFLSAVSGLLLLNFSGKK